MLEQTDTGEFDDTFEEPPICEETFDRIQSTLEAVCKEPKLHELADSEDEEIAEAADEALMMANPM